MITGVAIKDRNDKVWSLPKPNRHGHVIHLICQTVGKENGIHLQGVSVQGFLTDKNVFLPREEAWFEAKRCNQLLPPHNPINHKERLKEVSNVPAELFSEDLW